MDIALSIKEVSVLGSVKEWKNQIAWYKVYGQNLISKLAPVIIARTELANVL